MSELIDPQPARRLATTRTPAGLLHTYPIENDQMVVLDPQIRNGSAPTCCVRNGSSRYSVRLQISPALDRALRVAARAVSIAGPSMAHPAASLALASAGVSPAMLDPIEDALRAEGLTLGLTPRR